MIKARINILIRALEFFSDYLTEDCTLSGDGASADFAEVLNTAVTNISTTATATPVKPNPFEERFIGRLLLFKTSTVIVTGTPQLNSCNLFAFLACTTINQ